ncbi:MAG: hypothetical protein ACYC0C_18245 [Devosia sp.]
MASGATPPSWIERPPSAFDIVACYFPETNPKPDGSEKLRPALVLNVFRDRKTQDTFCEVAYGTTNLKFPQRGHLDLIIQNAADLSLIGLHRATRFDLDRNNVVILPWSEEYLDCWPGFQSPYIGTLTEEYLKELAWLIMKRNSV